MTGTDVVGSIPREVALLAELGLPPRAALAAASTSARRFLGFTSLDEGEPADLVSYGGDPRDDPAALGQPAAIFIGRHPASDNREPPASLDGTRPAGLWRAGGAGAWR